ncbi:MAG: T9SS type A sorting domain-containing protein [candidate division Zixibacteria bacterium]|nr:T9SS type A sorting domain-containing protein [Candidatus Tariuqbacter arcticus]
MIKKTVFLVLIISPVVFGQLPDFYHSYDETIDSLMVLESLHPDIMDMFVIGYSTTDSQEIYAVKISDNVDIDEDEPRLIFVGIIHAEENIGLELVIDAVTDFVTNASYFPWVMYIATAEIYFVPCMNPDGLDVVTDNIDITWRKNTRDNIGDGIFRYQPGVGYDSSGVDLNRNFGLNWIHGDTLFQTGHVELYDYYRGTAPFSENEAAAIRDFAEDKRFSLGIVYHQSRTGNVSENVIYPWNWAPGKNPPDFDVINAIGQELAECMHTIANPSIPYAAHAATGRYGNSHDWFYAVMGCCQYTIETSCIQPSDSTVLYDIIEDNQDGLIYLIQRAISNGQMLDEVGQLTGIITDAVTGEPLEAEVKLIGRTSGLLQPRMSDPVFGRFRWYLNHGSYHLQVSKPGYAALDSVIYVSQNYPTVRDLELEPLPLHQVSGVITDLATGEPISATLYFSGNMDTVVEAVNGDFSLELPESEYNLRIEAAGYVSYFQEINLNSPRTIDRELSPGTEIFTDDFEAGAGNWNTGGDEPWSIDYVEAHSGGASFTDHPGEDYPANFTSYAEFNVDLSDDTTAHLSFWHKYYLEPEHDFGYLEVSIDDGSSWELLDVFDLQDIDWRREVYCLNPFCSEQLIIRFTLEADGNINEAGWNIDNCAVIGADIISDTSENPSVPFRFYLAKPYPNPFNSSTIIRFSLDEAGYVEMSIYDMLGREIEKLISSELPQGPGYVRWNAGDLSSGVYFINFRSNNNSAVEKAVLLK